VRNLDNIGAPTKAIRRSNEEIEGITIPRTRQAPGHYLVLPPPHHGSQSRAVGTLIFEEGEWDRLLRRETVARSTPRVSSSPNILSRTKQRGRRSASFAAGFGVILYRGYYGE